MHDGEKKSRTVRACILSGNKKRLYSATQTDVYMLSGLL